MISVRERPGRPDVVPSDASRQGSREDGLRRVETDLTDAYEAICLAAQTGEVPCWDDLGAKVASVLAGVRQLRGVRNRRARQPWR